eukprot:scaffold229991_cov23-Tisochrysis_lutea.AAC.3
MQATAAPPTSHFQAAPYSVYGRARTCSRSHTAPASAHTTISSCETYARASTLALDFYGQKAPASACATTSSCERTGFQKKKADEVKRRHGRHP